MSQWKVNTVKLEYRCLEKSKLQCPRPEGVLTLYLTTPSGSPSVWELMTGGLEMDTGDDLNLPLVDETTYIFKAFPRCSWAFLSNSSHSFWFFSPTYSQCSL